MSVHWFSRDLLSPSGWGRLFLRDKTECLHSGPRMEADPAFETCSLAFRTLEEKRSLTSQWWRSLEEGQWWRSFWNDVCGVRFEVSTAVTMKNGAFWDVTPRGSCKNRRFGGIQRLHRHSCYLDDGGAKRRFLQEPHGLTSEKTPFFDVCGIRMGPKVLFVKEKCW
jgi:hypothetical protein